MLVGDIMTAIIPLDADDHTCIRSNNAFDLCSLGLKALDEFIWLSVSPQ